MENTILLRIFDFLKDYPPFHLFGRDQLLELTQKVLVQYWPRDKVIFRQGEMPGNMVYVVQQGAVSLYREEVGKTEPVEYCEEGDLFGLGPMLASDVYGLSAVTAEESLIYGIPVDVFTRAAQDKPKVWQYIAINFATDLQRYRSFGPKDKFFPFQDLLSRDSDLIGEFQSVEIGKIPLSCFPETTIQDAALKMTKQKVSSIIVINEKKHPIGIVTDKDLRRNVATGKINLGDPVSVIMSSPVLTVHPSISVSEVQMLMVQHQIHHLCITEDGSDNTAALGIITEHDLLVIQGNSPSVLLRAINRALTGKELWQIRERTERLLEKYIQQEVSISYISGILTALNDGLIRRALEIAVETMKKEGFSAPEAGFCWLALGSAGREEQLLRTDQDHALVFDHPGAAALEPTRAYYLQLAKRTTDLLSESGLEPCPANTMASNPQWCLSIEEWKCKLSNWIIEPDPKAVMWCSIFLDFRPIAGKKGFADMLNNHISGMMEGKKIFLAFLAKNALATLPPLTFFRDFLVERSGEHKHEFDIKGRAMMPLADAARVLALQHRIIGISNTCKRFEELAVRETQNRELYEQAAEAYELLMRFRTLQGLRRGDSGRFFKPDKISKMDRLILRNCFSPIQEIQALLRTRFQLDFF